MEEIKCYICGRKYKSKAALTRHINSCQEIRHIQYKQHIDRLKNSCQENNDYKFIGCSGCKCDTCNPNIFALCLREEKKIYLNIKKQYEKEEKRKQRLEVHASEEKRKYILKNDRNSPFNLLKEFYASFNGVCINYSMELAKLKRMLSYGVTPDCIRDTLVLMKDKGERDLKYFGKYAIQETVKLKEYLSQIDMENTLPFLVKKYYTDTGAVFSNTILIKDVDRLNKIKNEYNLDINKLSYIIDYMIRNKVQNFCFLDNNVSNALRELNNSHKLQMEEKKKDSNEYYLNAALDDIINGNITVNDTISLYGKEYASGVSFQKKALEILETDKYNDKYSAMEWAYKVGFIFNKKTYELAKAHTYKKTSFVGKEKEQYLNWLRQQKNTFE